MCHKPRHRDHGLYPPLRSTPPPFHSAPCALPQEWSSLCVLNTDGLVPRRLTVEEGERGRGARTLASRRTVSTPPMVVSRYGSTRQHHTQLCLWALGDWEAGTGTEETKASSPLVPVVVRRSQCSVTGPGRGAPAPAPAPLSCRSLKPGGASLYSVQIADSV